MAKGPYAQLISRLEDGLPELTHEVDPATAARAVTHSRQLMEEMIRYCQQHGFSDSLEEIAFFRHLFPNALAYWLTWHRIHELESVRPPGPPARQVDFYSERLRHLEPLLQQHRGSAAWLLELGSEARALHFIAHPADSAAENMPWLLPGVTVYNPHSYTLSRYWSAQRTAEYLLHRLEQWVSPVIPAAVMRQPLKWVQTKVALSELVYALHEYGAFEGRPEISRVAAYIGQVFGMPLGIIYKTYENMRLRKKNRTPFLDALRLALERRMDQDDLHAL